MWGRVLISDGVTTCACANTGPAADQPGLDGNPQYNAPVWRHFSCWKFLHALGDGAQRRRRHRDRDDRALLPVDGRHDHEFRHRGGHGRDEGGIGHDEQLLEIHRGRSIGVGAMPWGAGACLLIGCAHRHQPFTSSTTQPA